jgi:hypothetical protein
LCAKLSSRRERNCGRTFANAKAPAYAHTSPVSVML